MIIKYKHRIKKKSINSIILRFQRKGSNDIVYTISLWYTKNQEKKKVEF